MIGYAPILGQVRLVTPRLGAVISPYTMMTIPTFEVTLTNGGRTKTATVGFDTGLEDAHVQIPTSLAKYLGVVGTGTEGRSDATKRFVSQTGTIDKISAGGCSIENAKVLFFEDAPFLVGNDFIRDVGAEFTYESGVPGLKCSGTSQSRQIMSPIFAVSLIQAGKVHNASAFFDTGFSGADVVIPWSIATRLGLPTLKTTQADTHTGTVTLVKSKLDRLTLQGMSSCYVDDADVRILPASSPLQEVIVGEGFFKKVNGRIGYDKQGALFSCGAAAGVVVRPIGEGIIPDEVRPAEPGSGVTMDLSINRWPLVIGALGVAGAIAYFAWPRL